MQQARRTGF